MFFTFYCDRFPNPDQSNENEEMGLKRREGGSYDRCHSGGRVGSHPLREQGGSDDLRASRHHRVFKGLEKAMLQPRDEAEFQTFLTYLGDLDAKRGTNFLDLWPEFRPYVDR